MERISQYVCVGILTFVVLVLVALLGMSTYECLIAFYERHIQ